MGILSSSSACDVVSSSHAVSSLLVRVLRQVARMEGILLSWT